MPRLLTATLAGSLLSLAVALPASASTKCTTKIVGIYTEASDGCSYVRFEQPLSSGGHNWHRLACPGADAGYEALLSQATAALLSSAPVVARIPEGNDEERFCRELSYQSLQTLFVFKP